MKTRSRQPNTITEPDSVVQRAWSNSIIRDLIISALPECSQSKCLVLNKQLFLEIARHLYRDIHLTQYLDITQTPFFPPNRLVALTESVRILDLRGSLALHLQSHPLTSLISLFPKLETLIFASITLDFRRKADGGIEAVEVVEDLEVDVLDFWDKKKVFKEKDLCLPADWNLDRSYNLSVGRYTSEREADEEERNFGKNDALPVTMKLSRRSIVFTEDWNSGMLRELLSARELQGYDRIPSVKMMTVALDAGDVFEWSPRCEHLRRCHLEEDEVLFTLKELLEDHRWENLRGMKSLDVDVVARLPTSSIPEPQVTDDISDETESNHSISFTRPLDLETLTIRLYGDPLEIVPDLPSFSDIAEGLLRIAGDRCEYRFFCPTFEEDEEQEDRLLRLTAAKTVSVSVKKEMDKILGRAQGESGWRKTRGTT